MKEEKVCELEEYRKKKKGAARPGGTDGEKKPRGRSAPYGQLLAALAERRWLFLAVAVAALLWALPLPPGLSEQGRRALALWAFVVTCFLTEALPLPFVALAVGTYQVFAGLVGFQEAPRTFMDDAVFFIAGVLMMGAVLMKHHIHTRATLLMLKVCGTQVKRVVLGVVGFCALGAAFFTEHAAVMIMFPIGVGLVALSGGYRRVPNLARLLMLAISYGVIVGGLAAPSGGARNALMVGFLSGMGINVGYGQWMLMAFPLTLLLVPLVAYWLMALYPPEVDDLREAVQAMEREMEAAGPPGRQGWLAAAVFSFVLLGWVVFSPRFGAGNIAMAGVLLAAVLRLVDWGYLQQKTPWGVVVLYAGAISLGRLLISTGAAGWLAGQLLRLTGGMAAEEDVYLLAVTATITALVTQTMADGPTVAALGPVFLKAAEISGISPLAVGVATSLASAFSYLLVIATPANAIVYGAGFLKARDFLRAGTVLLLVSLVLLVSFLANFWWRLLGVW
ncbi:SLC13 family permease [Desulfovirgula thermocuniculi]|uniref:SLC13 family permease n=1 Tax=Desulfovirgula thermocuniculi TaxID=348842 RepID=UPI0004110D27|nr:DASS family sodium-coupled anion symporter [Desulfovirgula thermocuniculi]